MAKKTTQYRCQECGKTSAKWMGRCPDCQAWSSMVEETTLPVSGAKGSSGGTNRRVTLTPADAAVPITHIDPAAAQHIPTGLAELDRVLGAGIVPGSAILLAGEPGVGKSTLLLEVAHAWAHTGKRVLYVTAEESAGQVRHRAQRTGALDDQLYLAAESDLENALAHVDAVSPELIIIDSLQTLQANGVEGVAGGVTQIRAVAATLTALAKNTGIPVIIVGHVTKEGAVAGPRTVEHLVDVVLHFEGDKHSSLRMLRGLKNRFGAADEVGCFEQTNSGISEVSDPSGLFLNHRDDSVAGTAVTVVMDGKRPLLGEIQTLAVPSDMHTPRRVVTGIDANRVSMILAVLAQRAKLQITNREIYAATVGGMKISEPSADLSLALAFASTVTNKPLPEGLISLGEVGLGGEIRRVPQLDQRLAEAARLGFNQAIVPAHTSPTIPEGMTVHKASTLAQALFHAQVSAQK